MTRPYSALDFCRKISTWQEADGASTGLPMVMPGRETSTLGQILAQAERDGPSPYLEERARFWLVGYRELEAQQVVLTTEQRAELNAIVNRLQAAATIPRRPRRRRTYGGLPAWHAALLALVLAVSVIIAVIVLVTPSGPANTVQAGGPAQQQGQAQQIPAGTTALQQFEADWGPFRQLAVDQQHPQSGAPALLFLRDGGYYVTKWALPAGGGGWAPDNSGTITGVTVHGTWAVVTDADLIQWVVGVRQPFVLASDPGTAYQVSEAGDVLSMPEPHAIVVRTPA